MRTFNEFVEQRDKAISFIDESLNKIYEEAEKNPILKQALVQEGWGDVGQAIKQGWQGLWGGAKVAYYDAVMKNLNGLIQAVEKTAKDASTTGQNYPEAQNMIGPGGWLIKMRDGLAAQSTQFARGSVSYTKGAPGTANAGVQWNTPAGRPGDVGADGSFTPTSKSVSPQNQVTIP
jgi:hypothetical protein